MKIDLNPGRYVAAVSGGVDSMVLLHLLKSQIPDPNSNIIVAHFDHGIHDLSANYCDFVAKAVKKMELKFVSAKGDLGPNASEAKAREARYKFLREVKERYDAGAILTAHHQDDQIETIVINIIRGTGRKGLTSLGSGIEIIRPLLGYTKQQILEYAKKHNIVWKEDPTNQDVEYLRNYLRINVLPKMSLSIRQKLLQIAEKAHTKNQEIKEIIESFLMVKDSLDRKIFNRLDHSSSKEILADFLRYRDIPFDKKMLEQCTNFIKTAAPGKKFSVSKNYFLEIKGDEVKLNLL